MKRYDDFMLPSGALTTHVAEFGESWKTNIECNDGELTTGLHVDACAMGTVYIEEAKSQCAVLRTGEC